MLAHSNGCGCSGTQRPVPYSIVRKIFHLEDCCFNKRSNWFDFQSRNSFRCNWWIWKDECFWFCGSLVWRLRSLKKDYGDMIHQGLEWFRPWQPPKELPPTRNCVHQNLKIMIMALAAPQKLPSFRNFIFDHQRPYHTRNLTIKTNNAKK